MQHPTPLDRLSALSAAIIADPPQTAVELVELLGRHLGVEAVIWTKEASGSWKAQPTSHGHCDPESADRPGSQRLYTLTECAALTLAPAPEAGPAESILHALIKQSIAGIEQRDQCTLLTNVFDAMPEGVIVSLAPQGEVILANPAAKQLFGRRIEAANIEEYANNPINTKDGHPLPPHQIALAKVLQTGYPLLQREYMLEQASGKRIPILTNAAPLIGEDGEISGAVVIFQDMARWHRLEEERDDAIAAIAHDLKNPLTTIRGSAELVLRRARTDGRGEREIGRLETIIGQADRMRDFLGSLVDVARLHSGKLALVKHTLNVEPLVRRIVEAINSSHANPRIMLDTNSAPEIEGDQIWLERVIDNLLDNALKYSPQDSEVRVRLWHKGRYVRLSVQDQGIGIDTEDLERIFDRFTRGQNISAMASGSGLGLFTVRAVVRAHGGTIIAQSEGRGKGSTFIVTLPVKGQAPKA